MAQHMSVQILIGASQQPSSNLWSDCMVVVSVEHRSSSPPSLQLASAFHHSHPYLNLDKTNHTVRYERCKDWWIVAQKQAPSTLCSLRFSRFGNTVCCCSEAEPIGDTFKSHESWLCGLTLTSYLAQVDILATKLLFAFPDLDNNLCKMYCLCLD